MITAHESILFSDTEYFNSGEFVQQTFYLNCFMKFLYSDLCLYLYNKDDILLIMRWFLNKRFFQITSLHVNKLKLLIDNLTLVNVSQLFENLVDIKIKLYCSFNCIDINDDKCM